MSWNRDSVVGHRNTIVGICDTMGGQYVMTSWYDGWTAQYDRRTLRYDRKTVCHDIVIRWLYIAKRRTLRYDGRTSRYDRCYLWYDGRTSQYDRRSLRYDGRTSRHDGSRLGLTRSFVLYSAADEFWAKRHLGTEGQVRFSQECPHADQRSPTEDRGRRRPNATLCGAAMPLIISHFEMKKGSN